MTDFKRVYLDTSPIIYYLEHSQLYVWKMKGFLNIVLIAMFKLLLLYLLLKNILFTLTQVARRN